MIKSFVCLMAAVASVGAVPASAAETQLETVTGVIHVSDFDFTEAGDIARFERRVRQRARMLCGVGGGVGLTQRRAEQDCVASVKASAQLQLPQLIAASRAKAGQRLASKGS